MIRFFTVNNRGTTLWFWSTSTFLGNWVATEVFPTVLMHRSLSYQLSLGQGCQDAWLLICDPNIDLLGSTAVPKAQPTPHQFSTFHIPPNLGSSSTASESAIHSKYACSLVYVC